jgi:rhodanese-related sulfurtransferase
MLAAATTGLTIVAGCLGTSSNGSETETDPQSSEDENAGSAAVGYELGSASDPDTAISAAGLPPEPDPAVVAEIEPTDESEFEMNTYRGIDVPLVPATTARYWYHEQKARFVDARSNNAYQSSHIPGALSSPAGSGRGADTVDQFDETARIVTYCGCPHHLSSHRAMELYKTGHTAVFAIDEGFGVWTERGYAATGADSSLSQSWKLQGQVSTEHAGEIATVKRPGDEQLLYAKPIAPDGTFSLTVKAIDVDEETVVLVNTPAGTHRATVGKLASETITA